MSISKTSFRTAVSAVALAVTAALALPAQAAKERASRQENIGVVSGLTVGAVAGGPFGAIVGAAAGAWLGDRYHQQAVAKNELEGSLGQSEAERMRLAQNVTSLNGSLVNAQSWGDQLGTALDRTRDIETEIGFRTGDTTVSAADVERLKKLGALADAMPDAKVRIAGYADPRGPEEYNKGLSLARADAVAAVLTSAGISTDKLIVEAHGASTSTTAEGDLDGYAMDRKVTLRIEHGGSEALARRQ